MMKVICSYSPILSFYLIISYRILLYLVQGWQWPLTCCVLTNGDPNDPDPEDEAGCFAGLEGTVHEQVII